MNTGMKKIHIGILSFIFCAPLFAATHYKDFKDETKTSRHVIISLAGGAGFASNAGESETFPIINPIRDENYFYDNDDSLQTRGIFNAFIGWEWPIWRSFDVQAGLSYYYLGLFSADGNVTQGADVQSSDTYKYHYNIRNQQLLIESKWLYAYKAFHPYLLLGLGAAFNSTNAFEVDIVPSFTTFSRVYSNHDTTAFTYTAGLGLDYDLYSFVRIGVGYRFTNLGKVSLGDAVIDTTPVSGTLSQPHLYVNEVLVQLTFVV